MRRGIVICVAGTLAVLIAAASAWPASTPSGPDPAVEEWPAWPYLTQCEGGVPFYGPAAFSGHAEAELGSRPSEVALREALAKGEIAYAGSPSNWRLLAEDETRAEFAHGRLGGQLEWVSFELQQGQWKYRRYSSHCEPTSIVGRGPVVTWDLAEPEEPAPNAVVRRIKVNLGPGECSSGRPQNPRTRLVFRKWGRKLLMVTWLKPLPPGYYSCERIHEPPLKITLPRKMKLSKLYDGSTYPPTPAIG